jgi:hypothetical protein
MVHCDKLALEHVSTQHYLEISKTVHLLPNVLRSTTGTPPPSRWSRYKPGAPPPAPGFFYFRLCCLFDVLAADPPIGDVGATCGIDDLLQDAIAAIEIVPEANG